MSTSLSLRLQRTPAIYSPRETIQGTVALVGSQPSDALIVTITLRCSSSGEGNAEDVVLAPLRLRVSPSDAAAEYAFERALPAAPLSYAGKLFTIDWQVVATALLDGEGLTSAVPFLLVPATAELGAHPYRDTLGDPIVPASRAGKLANRLAQAPLRSSAVAAIGALVTIAGVVLGESVTQSLGLFLSLSVGGYAGSRWRVFLRERSALAGLKGTPAVTLHPAHPAAGASLEVAVSLPGTLALPLAHAVAVLTADELATKGAGSNSTLHRHCLHTATATFPFGWANRAAGVDSPNGSVKFDLPAELPGTLKMEHHEVRWSLKIQLRGEGFPNWEREVTLEVRPCLHGASR